MKKGDRTEIDEKKLSDAVEGKKVVYPSILKLDEGDLECIKEWKVGEEYKVLLTVKMVAASSKGDLAPYNDSDKEKLHAEFEVVKAEDVEEEDDKEEKE
jgi:hypothetical protein